MSRREAPGARHWNTWDPVHPAELVHLPTGVHVGLAAYSDAAGRFSRFPPGAGVTLGPRTVDATAIDLELALAGTRLAVRIGGAGPESFKIAWRILANGEWGLRFWLLVCLWCEGGPGRDGVPARDGEPGGDGGGCAYDPSTTEMTAPAGDGWVVVKGSRFPLMATFHHDLAALKAELEDEGYFYLASRGTAGPLGVLRYNLEEMPAFEVAAAWAPDRGGAAARADGALAAGPPAAAPALHGGRFEGALDALRDCVAWNTVWDASNRRPYTALSRSWVAQKFGGWGVWLNDVVYHGLMGGLFDADLAHENQRAVFDGATPAGNLPCLVTGNDAWVDRSQPPIVGFVTWCQYLRGGDRRFLEDAWPVLSANHEWWWRERDGNRNGLLEYGTSPVGDGLYRGTKLAAKDESMMDNSPVHDEAVLMEAAHTLDCEDVALNSFVALDGEMLALIARALGLGAEAAALEQRTEGLKTRIREQLWDDRRRVFANRLWSGRFVQSLAPTSFFPLICGAASAGQANDLVERHLSDPRAFGGEYMMPAVSRADPAFADNVYWRGRIWPPLNFIAYYGLRRYGLDDAARTLAEASYRTFMVNWRDRICGENFNADSGRADDQPDTDLFYTWGALMAYPAVAEISDVNPWQGWTLTHPGTEALDIGPFRCPAGAARIRADGEWLTLEIDGAARLRTNAPGRWTGLCLDAGALVVDAPAGDGDRVVELPGATIAAAGLDGRPLTVADDGLARVALPPTRERSRLTIELRA